MAVDIRLFGSLTLDGPGGRLAATDFPTRKAKQVLQVLALAHGHTVSKDHLVDLLWKERLPRNPMATVELAVSLLRSALARVEAERLVITESGAYRLDRTVATVDATVFDELVTAASHLTAADRLDALLKALQVIGGDPLADEAKSEWAQPERSRYRRRIEVVRLDVARLALAAGDAAAAQEAAEAARLAAEFVLEETYALEITALAQIGRSHDARLLLHELEVRLAAEDGRLPSTRTLALKELLRSPAGRLARDASVAVDASFRSAPPVLPPLGRDRELATAESFVEQAFGERGGHDRLVVLQGAAGAGKSWLLDMLGERHRRSRPDRTVCELRCRPADRQHPMLAVSRLVRQLSRAHGAPVPMLEEGVTAMFSRLTDLLDRAGATLLLVDDLHHADDLSLAVLESVAVRDAACDVCVVATQPSSGEHRGSQPAGHSLSIGWLREDEVATLGIDGAWRETGGHPATLAACCAAGGGGRPLSGEQLSALLAPIDEMGFVARAVHEAAAGLGQPFRAAEVDAALALGPSVVVGELQRGVLTGVLIATDDQRFRFTGDVVRRALIALAGAAVGT